MKYLLTLLAFLLASAFAAPAAAQDDPPAVVLPAVGETLALERGDRTPWAGMLVRDEDLFALQALVATTQLALTNARDLLAQTVAGRQALLEAAAGACAERVLLHDSLWHERRDELAGALAAARSREGPRWYEQPALWFAAGALVAAMISVGLLAAIGGGTP